VKLSSPYRTKKGVSPFPVLAYSDTRHLARQVGAGSRFRFRLRRYLRLRRRAWLRQGEEGGRACAAALRQSLSPCSRRMQGGRTSPPPAGASLVARHRAGSGEASPRELRQLRVVARSRRAPRAAHRSHTPMAPHTAIDLPSARRPATPRVAGWALPGSSPLHRPASAVHGTRLRLHKRSSSFLPRQWEMRPASTHGLRGWQI